MKACPAPQTRGVAERWLFEIFIVIPGRGRSPRTQESRPRLSLRICRRVRASGASRNDAQKLRYAAVLIRPSARIASCTIGRAFTRSMNAFRFGHCARSMLWKRLQLATTKR